MPPLSTAIVDHAEITLDLWDIHGNKNGQPHYCGELLCIFRPSFNELQAYQGDYPSTDLLRRPHDKKTLPHRHRGQLLWM